MAVMYDISEFTRKMEALSKAFDVIPVKVGAVAVNFSKERFTENNWWDESKVDWDGLKNKRKGIGGKARKSQTPLVDTGRLKRSIRKIYSDKDTVIIGSDVPYAMLHNEGGTINKSVTVKRHTRRAHSRMMMRGRKKNPSKRPKSCR